ncbi:hypothetical protein [Burkholderia gladioli]|uniref:hypothetical protein n=1 Tax=Burkholderia gladioli TaxID=28095 RepID=UPI001640B949|nr:hypothetical protein [Burkholderia gladioli]
MKFRNLFNALVGLGAILTIIAAAIGTGHLLVMTGFFHSDCIATEFQSCQGLDAPSSIVGYFFSGIVVWLALAVIAVIMAFCYELLQTFGAWILNECKLLRKQKADNR